MPKSRGRQKPKKGARAYQIAPARKKRTKASPRWYGPLILGIMALGVLIIVGNYVQLLPGTDNGATNAWLWAGLGLIGLGFVGTTFWR